MKNKSSQLPTIYIVDSSVDLTGAFICARNEARILAGAARFVIVLPDESRIPSEELEAFSRVVRLPIVNLRRSLISFIRYIPGLFIAGWKLNRQMKKDGASCLQLNDFFLMHGAVCRLLGFKGKVVTWVRFDPRRFGYLLASLWLRIAMYSSDHIVVVSLFIQDVLPIKLKSILIYDTLHHEVPEIATITHHVDRMPRRLIYIGNYIYGKGQDDAITAFAEIAERFDDLELHFYGGVMGMDKNRLYRLRLERQAKELKLEERIRFHDFVKDTGSELKTAYAALNFSHSESFSMTCLEAAFYGIPVIATQSGGPAEIVADGKTGLLVPVGDTRAMATAIARLLKDPELAGLMGICAAQRARELFSTESFIGRLTNVFGLSNT